MNQRSVRSTAPKPAWWTLSFAAVVLLVLSCGDSTTSPDPARPPTPPPPAPPSLTISLAPADVTLTALDDTLRLRAEVRDGAGQVLPSAAVSWSSLNESVALVDAGLVTASGPGATRVRATSGSASAEARVTVMQVPAGLRTNPPTLEFSGIGNRVRLIPHFIDRNGHAIAGAVSATWSSGDRVGRHGRLDGTGDGDR